MTNDSDGETDETGAEEESGTGEDAEEKDTVSENDLEDEQDTVSENALDEDEKDETLEDFTEMPEDYQLTSMQMASKRELAAHLDEIMEMDEGGDYAEGELVVLVDSQEEAEQVAEAYNAEIKKLEYGVLTLKLNEGVSALKAMRVAADENVNLPAAWPNYYIYAYGEETAETVVESDDLIEVETTEYELEPADGNVEEADEPTYSGAAEYTDPYLSPDSGLYQYHHTVIGSAYAWKYDHTGSGIKVAVLDTGVNSHTDLPTVTGVTTNATNDLSGHGTHVAGIIAAQPNNNLGGVGVAPGVKLYAGNVLPDNGSGTIADAMAGVKAVSGQGGSTTVVDVINMSLGGLGYTADFQTVITAAYNNGVAIFAAAGNDGGNNYNYPACYDHVISVAATDQGNARASFSNYCNKVDLSAPGVEIYSTDAFSTTGYVSMSGTSMACPVATGEAAVILSAGLDELKGKTGGAKVDALLKVMKDNATKVGSGMGAGITNLAKVFNINVISEKPKTPTIALKAVGDELQQVKVTMKAQVGTTIYYTDNGKNPVYKNGAPDANTKEYTKELTISGRAKCDLRAIAVNESGACSKIVKKTYTLKPYVTEIKISGVNQVAKGKNIQLSATVMPTYAANKAVTWEIYTADANGKPVDKIDKTTDKKLETGVSITNKGKVAATKAAKTGSYVVKVTAKDEKKDSSEAVIHTPVSETYVVTVTDAVKVNSVKFAKKSLTLVKPTVAVESYDLKKEAVFEAKQTDSEGALVDALATDFKWSSNKEEVATVNASGVVTLHKAGKAVITALANDSSGKKATCTITVQQLATKVTIDGSNVVGKSKKNTYKAVVEPADATNKKVTWSLSEQDGSQWKEVDAKRAKEIGVSINAGNGTLSTTQKAVPGVYRINVVTKDSTEAAQTTAYKDVTVTSGLITKLKVQPTATTIYRTKNAFDVITSTTVKVTLEGKEGADLTAYTVTSSDVNGTIATVSEGSKSADGSLVLTVKATGQATGKVTLTAKATDGSNKSAKCTIKVNNPISGIRIVPSGGNNEYVAKGKSLQMKAILETGYGAISNKKVEWIISTNEADPKPITPSTDKNLKTGMKISSSGKVTATKKAKDGWYNVYAIAKDGSAMAVYYIHVAAPTTRIAVPGWYPNSYLPKNFVGSSIGPISSDIKQGSFSISSSNPSVISVSISNSGYVNFATGKSGSATITLKALDGSGKSVKYKIKLKDMDINN